MSDVKLGKLIEGIGKRDAIHVAVAPVTAGEDLNPGDHVEVRGSGAAYKGDHGLGDLVGVVDPFLKQAVKKGERFWLCLYQFSTTGMRHAWSHPKFEDDDYELPDENQLWCDRECR